MNPINFEEELKEIKKLSEIYTCKKYDNTERSALDEILKRYIKNRKYFGVMALEIGPDKTGAETQLSKSIEEIYKILKKEDAYAYVSRLDDKSDLSERVKLITLHNMEKQEFRNFVDEIRKRLGDLSFRKEDIRMKAIFFDFREVEDHYGHNYIRLELSNDYVPLNSELNIKELP